MQGMGCKMLLNDRHEGAERPFAAFTAPEALLLNTAGLDLRQQWKDELEASSKGQMPCMHFTVKCSIVESKVVL